MSHVLDLVPRKRGYAPLLCTMSLRGVVLLSWVHVRLSTASDMLLLADQVIRSVCALEQPHGIYQLANGDSHRIQHQSEPGSGSGGWSGEGAAGAYRKACSGNAAGWDGVLCKMH